MISAETPVAGLATPTPEELLARDGWSRERLLLFQRERVRELLRHACASSPYYRDLLGRDAEDAELAELPTLSKATLMEQLDRVVTDRRLRLAAVEAHAASPAPGALLAGAYNVFSTSGTSGRRGLFPQTAAEFACWVAAVGRTLRRIGISPSARLIGIGAPTPLHITQKLFGALGGFGDGRPELVVTAPLPELVASLNRDQPEALLTAPSAADLLAQEQLEGRLSIWPRRVVLGGEVVAEDVKQRIGAAWGNEPFQIYASTEALALGSESPERVGLHVSEDLVVLEVVDEHDRPVPPGRPGYKVLVTSLVNRVLPLIRYELADTATIASGADPSGRPYTRIERVDGRSDDVLSLPARGGGEAVVLPYMLRAPFTHLPDVLQYQIVHDQRQLAVRVVLRSEASADTPAQIVARLRATIEAMGAVSPPITIEPVTELEREPGGAKVRLVKSVGRSPTA